MAAPPPLAKALDFRGRVALVTGGARGIGRGIAERFLEAGAEVAICGRNSPEAPPTFGGRSAVFFACDVRDAEQVARMTEAVVERFGRLDTLVANAGGAPAADAATASPRFHERIIQLNLVAPLHCAQRANAVMQSQPEGGVIELIASVSAIRPSPGTAAYGAAKAGLLSLAASLAVEWAPRVRVVAVTAGLIRTDQAQLHYGDDEGIAAVGRTIPLGRMGEPSDIADACLFLASPLARYVSGTSLLSHGGGEAPAFLGAAKNTESESR
jgi:NAD(P)-dependent dehydrogenase (short-subunit alcohol dehydrogenase family)